MARQRHPRRQHGHDREPRSGRRRWSCATRRAARAARRRSRPGTADNNMDFGAYGYLAPPQEPGRRRPRRRHLDGQQRPLRAADVRRHRRRSPRPARSGTRSSATTRGGGRSPSSSARRNIVEARIDRWSGGRPGPMDALDDLRVLHRRHRARREGRDRSRPGCSTRGAAAAGWSTRCRPSSGPARWDDDVAAWVSRARRGTGVHGPVRLDDGLLVRAGLVGRAARRKVPRRRRTRATGTTSRRSPTTRRRPTRARTAWLAPMTAATGGFMPFLPFVAASAGSGAGRSAADTGSDTDLKRGSDARPAEPTARKARIGGPRLGVRPRASRLHVRPRNAVDPGGDVTQAATTEQFHAGTTLEGFDPARLRQIVDVVADGITVQALDGRIVYANDAAAQACGFDTADELLAAGPRGHPGSVRAARRGRRAAGPAQPARRARPARRAVERPGRWLPDPGHGRGALVDRQRRAPARSRRAPRVRDQRLPRHHRPEAGRGRARP